LVALLLAFGIARLGSEAIEIRLSNLTRQVLERRGRIGVVVDGQTLSVSVLRMSLPTMSGQAAITFSEVDDSLVVVINVAG
jgi:hypothetical protein